MDMGCGDYIISINVLALSENVLGLRFGQSAGRRDLEIKSPKLGHGCPNWDTGVPYSGEALNLATEYSKLL